MIAVWLKWAFFEPLYSTLGNFALIYESICLIIVL